MRLWKSFWMYQWLTPLLFLNFGFVTSSTESVNLMDDLEHSVTVSSVGQSLSPDLCAVKLEFVLGKNKVFESLEQLTDSLAGSLPEKLKLVIHSLVKPTSSLRLSLKKNRALLARRYQHIHYHLGRVDIESNSDSWKKECYYDGVVTGDKSSHAAVNFCNGQIDGIIFVDGIRYVVESKATEGGNMVRLVPASQYWDDTWTDESAMNVRPENSSQSCDFPSSHKLNNLKKNSFNDKIRMKRETVNKKRLKPTPGYYSDYLDGKIRYVELVLVNDYSVYRKFNSDKDLVETRSRQIANIVNALYFPLNIRVALVGVETWTEGDTVTIPNDGDLALQSFLRYRTSRLNFNIPNDNAQLLTDRVFKSGVVGKALKGTMCSFQGSGGVIMDHSRRIVSVASTVAHEMGHNFGMEHDNDTCDCPGNERCIMSASSGGLAPSYWSSCSLEYFSWGLQHGSDYCLENVPEVGNIFRGPVCGNGFKEEGEECDCGFPSVCKDSCCNASTCKLAEGAECANGECCDKSKCKLKKATTVCRAEKNQCDLAEYCDGKSEECPSDVFKQNGISCADKEGYCFAGKCGLRDDQCRLLWGYTGYSSPDLCYERLNRHRNVHGNCGYDKKASRYSSCFNDDVMCGRLHCVHQNEKTEFGDRAVVQTAHTFLQQSDGKYAVCRVAQYSLGGPDDVDPGMVPGGAKCGENKMCSSSRCIPVENVLKVLPCDPPNCNGVGICNSKGHCHCDFGYGGVDCGKSGLGGSIDSGPSGPSDGFNVALAVLIFVLVIFPLITATLTFLYRKKHHWLTKYKILRHFLPKQDRKAVRVSSNSSSASSSPSHRLVFAAKPPPINGIPVSEAQELERARRANKSLTTLEIPPTFAPVIGNNSQSVFTANTLPRLGMKNSQISTGPNNALMTTSAIDFPVAVSTLNRSPSQRPKKPAPPRPKRPKTTVIDQVSTEGEADLPTGPPGLLNEVLTALESGPLPIPHRRAPAPPVDPVQPVEAPLKPPKRVTPPPEDPGEEQWAAISDCSKQTLSISGPSNPVIGGQLVTKSPELTVVPSVGSSTQTLPRRVQRTSSSGGENSDCELPGKRVQRSVSSASSSSGRSRPSKAPPPPPKKAPLVEADSMEEEEENYYDVIPTPPQERPPRGRFAANHPKITVEKQNAGVKPPWFKKPPLPAKPPGSFLAHQPSDSKVSALRAKFDQKSGGVTTSLVK